MSRTSQITPICSWPLTLFLAMQREAAGRPPWELCLLARPTTPEMGDFVAGIRALCEAGMKDLPVEAGESADVASFMAGWIDEDTQAGPALSLVRSAMSAVEPELGAAIDLYAPARDPRKRYVHEKLLDREDEWLPVLTDALGVAAAEEPFPIYLVPFAPYPPGSGFLIKQGQAGAAYVDYRRYSGPTLLESMLTLLSWRLLSVPGQSASLGRIVAAGLPGGDRPRRKLRAILVKLLVALTAQRIVAQREPGYTGTVEDFGLDLRFPRLLPLIRGPWTHYLQGHTTRARCLTLIMQRLSAQPAAWFIEQIDAASLAADFYLLEWMAAQGDVTATARLANWQPRLAAAFNRHLDFAVGAELAHYDAIPLTSALSPDMVEFLREVCNENSLLRWPSARRRDSTGAYRMAEEAFLGPGREYGGEAWAPVARLMAQYSDGTLSDRLFIDQCFTLEHNNGCLFDKFFDAWDMQSTLEAQAAGDLDMLAAQASPEVRRLYQRYLAQACTPRNALWSVEPAAIPEPRTDAQTTPVVLTGQWPEPGSIGCGSKIERSVQVGGDTKLTYRGTIRKPHRRDVPKLRSAAAVLHTDLGPVSLELFPEEAPLAVGTFVQLARGEAAWHDPVTGTMRTAPFYDDTRFHRRVRDYVLQAGDRTETGRGGPGFRYDEEPSRRPFDRPYLVAMVNTGIVTNGSQFFITLTEAPHLNGQYTIIGEVADDGSRDVARRLAASGRSDLRIRHVEVSTS